jgi:3-deoxy-7-phosphoheptulonate synthase
MIVVMRAGAAPAEIEAVVDHIQSLGFRPHLSEGEERTIIGVIGNDRRVDPADLTWLPGVEKVVPILAPYKLASRDFQRAPTVITLDNGVRIGGPDVVLMAGPCSVESRAQTFEAAAALHALGVRVLRGGAFKPRTSPYAFQGLGEPALHILAEVRAEFGLAIVTEVMGPDEVELVGTYADVLQVGARNMQNYRLLEAVGRQARPVLLKRAPSATTEELLLAAEYILAQGNRQVMVCERGIRSYDPQLRNTFDLNAVPLLKLLTHLPVIADPSHGTGRRDLVGAVSRAALAAGADGLIVEVHAHPEAALSDGAQSLRPADLEALLPSLQLAAAAGGRTMAPAEGNQPAAAPL